MRPFAIALIALGALGLALGIIGYTKEETILQVGDFKATATDHKSVPIAPILGVVALIGGVALLGVKLKRA